MVWSLVFVLIVLAVLRHWNWLGDVRRSPALLGKFAVSALLLAGNWLSLRLGGEQRPCARCQPGLLHPALINVAWASSFARTPAQGVRWVAFAWPPPACCGWQCNRAMCPGWRC